MEVSLNWLNNNPWITLIFLVLSVISIFLAIYLYRRGRKTKQLAYDKRSVNVISDNLKKISDIKVTLHGNAVENLTVSKFAIWNYGNETINYADHLTKDKFRLESFDSVRMLEVEIIHSNEEANNILFVPENENQMNITFDYLDPNDGCIIKVIHDGKKSSDIHLLGTFKEIKQIKRINSSYAEIGIDVIMNMIWVRALSLNANGAQLLKKFIPWGILTTGLILVIAFFVITGNTIDKVLCGLMALACLALGLTLLLKRSKTIPKGFEMFFDDE